MDKLQKIKDLYAEDKLINNRPDYSLNEFFGTIQIGLKDIDNKSLKVTKNPTMRYVVYDGDKELAYLDNSKGNVFYDDNMYGRFNSIRQSAKKDPEKKQELNNIISNPNMSYFPIEEIEFTQEERNEMFRNVRGRMSSMIAKYYKEVYGDNLISIDFNNNTIQINFNGANDENDFNRILKTEFHSAFNKFGLALAKLVLDQELKDRDDLIDFKASLLQMIDQEGEDNIDETLNGMNVQEIIEKYGVSLATEEDAMISRIFNMERTESNYTVVKIDSYQKSKEYNKYWNNNYVSGDVPGAWCVTYGEGHFNSYVDLTGNSPTKGEVFYFLLREPDWKEQKRVPNNRERNVNDEFGTSMIAVSIRPDGMIHTSTSRYNHGVNNAGNTDKSYSEEDISRLLGRPIFEALPPSNPMNAPTREDKSQEVIKAGTKVLTSGDRNREIIQYKGSYYLVIEGSVFKDRRTKKLFQFSNIRKIKKTSDGSVAGYLFYYSIADRNDKKEFVIGLDKNLKMIISSKKVGEEETTPIELARAVLALTSVEED